MGWVALLDFLFGTICLGDVETTSFDVLLGVVPSTTRVGGGEGDLDTGDDTTSEDTVGGLVAEERASKERGEDNKKAGSDHFL